MCVDPAGHDRGSAIFDGIEQLDDVMPPYLFDRHVPPARQDILVDDALNLILAAAILIAFDPLFGHR